MITRHFRSNGYEDKGKMYHFALARSTQHEKKDLPLDCDNAVSFDNIISNVKTQIAFLKYRTVRQKKGIILKSLFLLCCK